MNRAKSRLPESAGSIHEHPEERHAHQGRKRPSGPVAHQFKFTEHRRLERIIPEKLAPPFLVPGTRVRMRHEGLQVKENVVERLVANPETSVQTARIAHQVGIAQQLLQEDSGNQGYKHSPGHPFGLGRGKPAEIVDIAAHGKQERRPERHHGSRLGPHRKRRSDNGHDQVLALSLIQIVDTSPKAKDMHQIEHLVVANAGRDKNHQRPESPQERRKPERRTAHEALEEEQAKQERRHREQQAKRLQSRSAAHAYPVAKHERGHRRHIINRRMVAGPAVIDSRNGMLFENILHVGDVAVDIVRISRVGNVRKEYRPDSHTKEENKEKPSAESKPTPNQEAQDRKEQDRPHIRSGGSRRTLVDKQVQARVAPVVLQAERKVCLVPDPVGRKHAILQEEALREIATVVEARHVNFFPVHDNAFCAVIRNDAQVV